MTLTITLNDEEVRRLRAMAERAGVDQETVIRQLIGTYANPIPDIPRTPADAIDYWRANGVIGSYGDPSVDSTLLAREIRKKAESGDRS